MTMATFPCPPLPMIGSNLHNEDVIVNSHDLLSFLMNTAARRDVKAENEARVPRQQELYKQYFAALAKGGDLWGIMTTFTRSYMMTYTHAMHSLRFFPFDAAPPPVKKQVCSWLAAQLILQGDSDAKADDFLDMGHDKLYSKCALVIQKVDEGVGAGGCNDVQSRVQEHIPARIDVLSQPEA